MKSNLSAFNFMGHASGVVSKKPSPNPWSPEILFLYSRRFAVLDLAKIHFLERYLVSDKILFHVDVQLFQRHLLKRLFSIKPPLELRQRSAGRIRVHLFLGSVLLH